jgi:acetolactate synthase-1/2/3 large subunit
MIVARRIAATLKELGIERVYGLPGEDHMTLLDAFADVGITYHPAVNESSAVIMAATDAQVTGLPGVVVLSLAPGISNGVNGLAHAALEFSPVLVISGNFPAHREPFVVRQWLDLRRLVEPYVKWSGKISAKTDVILGVLKALDIASAYRPGPVFLEVPDEVAKEEESTLVDSSAAIEVLKTEWRDRGQSRLVGSPPTLATVESLRTRLASATHPVLVVGGRRADVSKSVLDEFSSKYRIPVFTSSGQKGLTTSDSEYFAGTFLNGSLETRLLDQSDALIWINPEAFDYYNKPWPYADSLHSIAITPAALEEWLYPFSERIVAAPDLLLRALLDADVDGSSQWTIENVTSYRDSVRAALLPDGVDGMSVPQAVDAALRSAPAGTRLTADAGFGKPIVAMLSEPTTLGDYHASNGLSTMGYSIPAAIAAARASRGPVLAFLGDGSLLMRGTELVYAANLPSPLVIVATMDKSLSQIEIKQERLGLRPTGVTLPAFSCELLAQSIGVEGADVNDLEELNAALEAAWRRGGTTLIGARISPESSRTFFEVLRG